VRSLLPETIKRVEWLTNPGLRYNAANYVLNFIVSNPSLGGSLMLNALQAMNVAWGDYMASAKFNSGRSQWEIDGHFRLTDHMKATREYHETFTRPNGHSLTRTERPVGGHISGNNGNARISYNYIKTDTTVFYLSLNANREFSNESRFEGILSMSDGSGDIVLNDSHGANGTTPSVSAYLERHFAKNQTLVVDLGSSLYMGRSFSDYIEGLPDAKANLTDIHTSIKDRNQAYAIEADYIKNWNASRLTLGASYNANRNRSEYENLSDAVFHQRQDRIYVFAEYFRKYSHFTFTAGLGTQYTDFRFRETDEGNATWSLRPKATVTYALNRNHQFRLGFTSWQSAPSLMETNIAPLQIDGFQWRIGNPYLKTSTSYMLMLNYNFGLADRIYGVFGVRAFTSPNAITPLIEWREDRLVTTYENSRGLQNLSFFLAPQIHIIQDWLTASGYLQFRAERMRGTGYDLHNSAWSGD
ncbi:MAG: outer membrane beta-barrel family protein, partial [Muribaculaceae bacterium]|nr:outer membrane beta-barrel family protein [Muribaculaceae bacterium]